MAASNDRSAKDKQMAARLKAAGDERWTGVCPVCYSTIRNSQMFAHISLHARGAEGGE